MGDQSRRAAGAQVLGVDRWVNLVLAQHLPADVDLQGRVRRVWPDHRAQEVLLSPRFQVANCVLRPYSCAQEPVLGLRSSPDLRGAELARELCRAPNGVFFWLQRACRMETS